MHDHKEACLNAVHVGGSVATLEHIAKYKGETELRYLRNTAIFINNFLHSTWKSITFSGTCMSGVTTSYVPLLWMLYKHNGMSSIKLVLLLVTQEYDFDLVVVSNWGSQTSAGLWAVKCALQLKCYNYTRLKCSNVLWWPVKLCSCGRNILFFLQFLRQGIPLCVSILIK